MKTNDNQMAPHFLKSVKEMDGDIAKLQADVERLKSLRAGLVDFYGGETEIDPPKPKARKGFAAKPLDLRGKTESAPPPPAARGGRPPSGNALKVMVAARTAAEPFTIASLVVASGADVKCVSNAVMRWKAKGWVQSPARGQYNRSASFPAETPADA